MRKLQSFLAGAVLFGAFGCSNKDTISISGEIQNPGNVKVVAFYEGDRKLDSVFLSDLNKFQFERTATQSRLFSVQIGNNKYPIILTPGEKVVFNADLQNPEDYKVEGSDLSIALKQFAPIKARKEFIEDSLQSDFTKRIVGKTEGEIDILRSEYLSQYKNSISFYTREAIAFSDKHNDLAGFYAVSTLDPELAESELIAYTEKTKDQFKENAIVNQFREEIEKLKKLAIGQPAPEFEAYTPNNKLVKLSDYRGKYVLVDFWASWCVPCRKENPNLVRIYNTYKEKSFEILGVSLDNNPGSWIRAIDEDKLTWTNISDLKAWSSNLIIDYRIKAIPSSVVLDPEGKIVAKNLRSKELEELLNSILVK
ncbi:TlpA family protein disulfide reductase [Sphingobacterium bovistauri]|uniref:TlpA family protein disulfide reductase n=1 Tax=Sphingobacterium bovistauri TaxID=2781959 RepID=A0ABS7Z4H3_9SPHI|nr:TlpA disulfide reductase family protein [Sphingobacterium bovistauri]MCA5004457.1 TlpA family protein disulfide reductase [Sphingobacterium bovistauri]